MSASNERGNFSIYLADYCAYRDVTEEVAMTHRIVQDVKAYYEKVEIEKVD